VSWTCEHLVDVWEQRARTEWIRLRHEPKQLESVVMEVLDVGALTGCWRSNMRASPLDAAAARRFQLPTAINVSPRVAFAPMRFTDCRPVTRQIDRSGEFIVITDVMNWPQLPSLFIDGRQSTRLS